MNKILKKLTKRNIVGNFKQFLSVIFIVLLSTMLLSGFITNSYTLKSCVDDYFEKTNVMKRDEFEKNLNYANEVFEKLTSN